MVDHCNEVSLVRINDGIERRLTDFAGAAFRVEKHSTAISKASATQQITPKRLAGLHRLQSKVSTHRLGDVIAIFAILDALLGDVLYLRAPVILSATLVNQFHAHQLHTCSGTRSEQSAQSC